MSQPKWRLRMRSSRINLFLISFSTAVLAVALVYVLVMIRQKSRDERARIRTWAVITRRQADLAQRVRGLYDDMEGEESQYARVWSFVYERVFDPLPSSLREFEELRQILLLNNRPFILVDRDSNIIESHDPDVDVNLRTRFDEELCREYDIYPPITVDAQGLLYRIYFKPSAVFYDIQNIFNSLERALSEENLRMISDIRVPVLITDAGRGRVLASANMDTAVFASAVGLEQLLRRMQRGNPPIEIRSPEGEEHAPVYVYFEPTPVLRHLRIIAWVLLANLLLNIMGLCALFGMAKRMEQNYLWWGMSKETAHQLGTPVSSLLAWTDYFKAKEDGRFTPEELQELEKDVKRIELVTNRFSKIGSVPELYAENVVPVVYRTVEYLKGRTSTRVRYFVEPAADGVVQAQINPPLIEWVLENLCKNALNAIGGKEGEVRIRVEEQGESVFVDVADNGKGMNPGMVKRIFEPGYTTKQRGWGVGLTLCKRIVEEYHGGKVFVKETAVGVGTVFRVVLRKNSKRS